MPVHAYIVIDNKMQINEAIKSTGVSL